MDIIISAMFGAGVATFAYTQLGKRVGYGNSQNVWTIVGVVFVLTSIIFYTVFVGFIKKS